MDNDIISILLRLVFVLFNHKRGGEIIMPE